MGDRLRTPRVVFRTNCCFGGCTTLNHSPIPSSKYESVYYIRIRKAVNRYRLPAYLPVSAVATPIGRGTAERRDPIRSGEPNVIAPRDCKLTAATAVILLCINHIKCVSHVLMTSF